MATYNDGDVLVDNKTWNVYQRTNGSWSLMGNIKGEKGDAGSQLFYGGIGRNMSPISVGYTLQLYTKYFNRTPVVGEKFSLFVQFSTVDVMYNEYMTQCEVTEVNSTIVTCKVVTMATLTMPKKFYQHNVKLSMLVTGVVIELMCTLVIDVSAKITNIDDFISAFVEVYGKDTIAPISGYYNILTSKTFMYFQGANYLSLTDKLLLRGYKINYNSTVEIISSNDQSLRDIVGTWDFNDTVVNLF